MATFKKTRPGHYEVTDHAEPARVLGKIFGDFVIGFTAHTAAGERVGHFPTRDEAVQAVATAAFA